jgi:hypothetical protein
VSEKEIYLSVHLRVSCVCVCECVCVKEIDREGGGGLCVCVCMCVCVCVCVCVFFYSTIYLAVHLRISCVREKAREIVCVCARACVFKTLTCIRNRRRMQPCLGEGQVLQKGLKEQTRKWWAARGSIHRRSNSNTEEGKRKSEERELGEQSGKGQVQLGVKAKG